MSYMKRIVDVECYLLAVTDAAIKVTQLEINDRTDTNDGGVWIPLSMCEYESTGIMVVTVTLAEWKAVQLGLV